MCGIIGGVNIEWSKSPLNSIKHRGPDFHSEFVIDNLYMGHTRLSIQEDFIQHRLLRLLSDA